MRNVSQAPVIPHLLRCIKRLSQLEALLQTSHSPFINPVAPASPISLGVTNLADESAMSAARHSSTGVAGNITVSFAGVAQQEDVLVRSTLLSAAQELDSRS